MNRDALIYNLRRFTGRLRRFPEVKGMSHKEYLRAYVERVDPRLLASIEVYEWRDGHEHRRRKAYPFAVLQVSIEKACEPLSRLGEAFDSVSKAFAPLHVVATKDDTPTY